MTKLRFSQAELKFAAVVGMTLNHAAGILLTDGIIREIMLLAGGYLDAPFCPLPCRRIRVYKGQRKIRIPTWGLGGHFPFCLFVRFWNAISGVECSFYASSCVLCPLYDSYGQRAQFDKRAYAFLYSHLFFDRRLGMVRNPMDDSFRPSQELP